MSKPKKIDEFIVKINMKVCNLWLMRVDDGFGNMLGKKLMAHERVNDNDFGNMHAWK